MRDIQQISNEELLSLAGAIPPQTSTAAPAPLQQLSNEQLLALNGMSPSPARPDFAAQSANQGTFLGNLGRGIVRGGEEVVSGLAQAGADVAGRLFPESETIQEFREILPEAIQRGRGQFEAQVGDSTGAQIGEFVGEAAPFVASLPAGAATLGGRLALAALGGAAAGATTPTEQQLTPEEALQRRGEQAAIGGTIGAAVPGAVAAAPRVSRAFRNAVSSVGSKLARINPQAAKDFSEAGVQQTLAAVSDSPGIKIFDRFLSKFPGGAAVVARSTAKTLDELQNVVDKAAVKKAISPEEAGLTVKRGIEGFANRFTEASEKLYNRLDRYLPSDSPISVTNSLRTLDEELAGVQQTPRLASRLERNEGIKVLQDIQEDAALLDGRLPYETIKRYRSLIGKKLNDFTLLGGEDRAILERAYGALTDDMADAARAAGPQAERAWERANTFYREGAERIGELQRLTNRDAEVIFDTMLQRAKGGGARINKVMSALSKEEQDAVRGTVIKRLGTPRPGQAGAEEGFSPRTFLTEWNKLAPEAKNALFGKAGAAQRESLDQIARVSDRLTQVDRFGNPSGTAQQVSAAALFLGGSFISPLTAVGAALGSNVSARLMNNPRFVKWLSKSATMEKLTPKTIAGRMEQLKNIAEKEPSIAEDIASYVGIIGATLGRDLDDE